MKRALTSWLMAGISAFLFACAGRPAPDVAAAPETAAAPDQTRYTAHSFFQEKGKHLTTNYRTGTLVPINTKVRIVSTGSKSIKIELVEGSRHRNRECRQLRAGHPHPGGCSRRPHRSGRSRSDRVPPPSARSAGMSKETRHPGPGYPPSHRHPPRRRRVDVLAEPACHVRGRVRGRQGRTGPLVSSAAAEPRSWRTAGLGSPRDQRRLRSCQSRSHR
jgi:hypothetical protein